jgi:pilus assembly protein CpaC
MRFAAATLLVAACVAAPSAQSSPSRPGEAEGLPYERISLVVGRSRVLTTDYDVRRLAVTNPLVADAIVVTPREVLIDAKIPGLTSLILWSDAGRKQYDVAVDTGASALQQQLAAVFPDEDIRAAVTDEAVVLVGRASSNEVAMRAAEIADASAAKHKVINLLKWPSVVDSQQVMLEVRFAEVEHDAATQLGLSLLSSRQNFDAGSSTQQFPTPFLDYSKTPPIQVPDYLNLFLFAKQSGILAILKALESRGQSQSLAEPNLIAYNGQEASFLAGGEFPVPLVQGNTGQVTVVFKEFGVRLTFRPTIAGDMIRLKVRPEVSTLDFANGLTLSGFKVPALKTRRAETDVELRDGQSFAIAGLLDNEATDDKQAIPVMSKLPIIGPLFRSKSTTKQRTELLVLITPHLVRPLDPTEVPALPLDPKMFIKPSGEVGKMLDGGGGLVDAPAAKPPKGPKE